MLSWTVLWTDIDWFTKCFLVSWSSPQVIGSHHEWRFTPGIIYIKSWRKLYFEKSLYSRWIILPILRIILTHCASQISQDPELGTVSTTCFTFSVLFWIFGLEVFGLSMCESGRDVGATPPKVCSMCGYSSDFSLGCPFVGCCLWRVWVPKSCHKLSLKYLKASPAVLLYYLYFCSPELWRSMQSARGRDPQYHSKVVWNIHPLTSQVK